VCRGKKLGGQGGERGGGGDRPWGTKRVTGGQESRGVCSKREEARGWEGGKKEVKGHVHDLSWSSPAPDNKIQPAVSRNYRKASWVTKP